MAEIERADRRAAILRAIDGRPAAAFHQVAAALGISRRTLTREMGLLRAAGLVRAVTILHPGNVTRPLECLTRLKVDWTCDQAIATLERRLLQDDQVLSAARVTGAFDYVLESRHRNKYVAAAFARSLRTLAAVTALHIDHVSTRFHRSDCASVLTPPSCPGERLDRACKA